MNHQFAGSVSNPLVDCSPVSRDLRLSPTLRRDFTFKPEGISLWRKEGLNWDYVLCQDLEVSFVHL